MHLYIASATGQGIHLMLLYDYFTEFSTSSQDNPAFLLICNGFAIVNFTMICYNDKNVKQEAIL